MWSTLVRGTGCGLATILPLDMTPYDKVVRSSATAKAFETRPEDRETGNDRLYMMFSTDDTGTISAELNSIYQAGFMGFMGGAVYGGFVKSRLAYMDFMENNQATAFKSHLEAKKNLQEQVTMSFAKGAFKWGWRLGLFTSAYVGIVTTVSVYRGKSSMYEYVSAGTITGALYKTNMGLRGMAVGGLLGGSLGGVAGVLSLLLLRVSGTSMEEVRYWQYKWRQDRDRTIYEVSKIEEDDPLMVEHERKLAGAVLNLEHIDAAKPEAATTETAKTQAPTTKKPESS